MITVTSFHMTVPQMGILVSASYVGQLFGSLLFGYLAEIYGRKFSFIACMGTFSILSIAAAFAWNVQSLSVIRVFQGLGIGALPPVAGVLFSEFLTASARGKMGVLFQTLYPVGAVISPVLGKYFFHWWPDTAWHLLFLVGGLPIFFAIYAWFRMPESPRWLADHGRYAQAEAVVSDIEKAAISAGKTLPPPVVLEIPAGPHNTKTKMSELFSPEYIRRTALIWIQSFTAFFIVNVFTTFLPQLLISVGGLDRDTTLTIQTWFTVAQLATVLTMAFVWDRHGRLPWFIGGYLVAVAGAGIAWACYDLLGIGGWVPIVFFGIPMLLGVYVNIGGVYVYHPELYPTRMRSWATGTGRAWRCIASAIAPFALTQILAANLGAGPIFLMFGGVALVGLVVVSWLGIETKNTALEKLAH
jgi:putative MFS transporter